jgi:hypothetical protein
MKTAGNKMAQLTEMETQEKEKILHERKEMHSFLKYKNVYSLKFTTVTIFKSTVLWH